MSVRLSGVVSGIDSESIISQLISLERRPIQQLTTQKNTISSQQLIYNNVKARTEDLLKSIKALTAGNSILSTGTNLFSAKKATVADTAIATATADTTAATQSFTLEVVSLATQTRAVSQSGVGQYMTAATPISQAAGGTITAGDFTVFLNGTPYTISVASGETVGDVLTRINTVVPDITVDPTVNGTGQVVITFRDSDTLQLGAATDTSNFLSAMKLINGTFANPPGPNATMTSQASVLAFNPNVALDGGAAGTNVAVTSGTFTINGVSFDTTGKTLNQLISEINNSSAKVTASFNPSANQFQLLATDPGSALITMADGTSNFLTAMGLIVGGNTTASQTAGANAQFKINGGATIYSPTNTVTEAISGLTGVTLTLTKQSSVGVPTTVTVARDMTPLTDALTDFVAKYNTLINYINDQTKSGEKASDRGPLSSESSVKRFKQDLRQMVTDQIGALAGTAFDSLQTIGISTGASTGVLQTDLSLKFDKAKFEAALSSDFDAVRKVVNATTANDGFDGTLSRMENMLKDALGTTATNGFDGLFAAYSTSSANRIKSLDEAIKRGEARLEKREAQMRQQFILMEQLMAQYQSQGSALAGIQSQLSSSQK